MNENIRCLIESANRGDIESMVMVGDCYGHGLYIEKDLDMSHKYYQMAADKGHVYATFWIGIDYYNGIGVAENKTLGIKYIQSAADKGVANAQYMMGMLYDSGEMGKLFKKKKVVHYYTEAANQGHAMAQIKLGDMNIQNKGSDFSLKNAIFWLACAFLHGDNAKEERDMAMDRLNFLIRSDIPGGKRRIEEVIEMVHKNYPTLIANPPQTPINTYK